MSGAAAVRALEPRKANKGYFTVPNSVAENLSLFTRAELALVISIFRRDPKTPTISLETWQRWTGLKPRMRDYAAKGLAKKGLVIEGRGDSARFYFHRERWDAFVKSAPPQLRAKTEGRPKTKAVKAKDGQMVHPDCRDRGCALMNQVQADENAADMRCGISLIASAPNSQPVADSSQLNSQPANQPAIPSPLKVIHPQKRSSGAFATPNPQPVADSPADDVTRTWQKTMAELVRIFPWVQAVFLVNLVAAVRSAGHTGVHDEELARAVQLAYARKQKKQRSEGLFLLTVPESLAAIRSEAPPVESPPGIADGVSALLGRCAKALSDNGLNGSVKAIEKMMGTIADGDYDDLQAIDLRMEAIERRIVAEAEERLSAAQLRAVDETAARRAANYPRMSQEQLEELRTSARNHAILEVLQIPRLGMLYA